MIQKLCFAIAFKMTDFSDTEMRFRPERLLQTWFPWTAVVKRCGMSIKHAEWSIPVQRALSTGGSEYKVKLSSISSNIFERSHCSHNRRASRIKRIVFGKCIRTTLCKTQFKKLYSTILSGARKLLVPRSHLHGKMLCKTVFAKLSGK